MTGHRPLTAVLGVGAMAMLFAGYLSHVRSVTALGTWSEQIEAVARDGLWITEPDGSVRHCRPAVAYRTRQQRPFDLIFVLVKSYQTERLCADLPGLLRPDGLAVTLQNGLGNLELLAECLGAARVLQGITTHGATLSRPGYLLHTGRGQISLAKPRNSQATPDIAHDLLLELLLDMLNRAGLPAEVVDDADALIWGKLAVNAAINPLTALLEAPNGVLLEDPLLRRSLLTTAREVNAVADALGVQLPFASVEDQTQRVARETAKNRSSMLQDILRGGPTEIEAINGAVVGAARRLGVPTPLNELLYRLVVEKETGVTRPAREIHLQLSAIIDEG